MSRVFFLVLARDRNYVLDKIKELEALGFPFRIICGQHLDHPNVIYQAPNGKFAAINFGLSLIPDDAEIVAMNDVDTRIHRFDLVLQEFRDPKVGLSFGTELIRTGPQRLFFRIMNPIRRRLPIAGSGELLLIRRNVLEKVCPLKPCKAEDTYILFKVLQLGYKIVFCEGCYAETERTKTAAKEELYKRKTVTGIYQAMSYAKPPYLVRLFYVILPLASPILLVMGKSGYYWMRGILRGLNDFLRGDQSGSWSTAYMD